MSMNRLVVVWHSDGDNFASFVKEKEYPKTCGGELLCDGLELTNTSREAKRFHVLDAQSIIADIHRRASEFPSLHIQYAMPVKESNL